MASPAVGDTAPDFQLPGTGGRSYSLAEYRGQPVVLVFYPGDNTPVCTKQLTSYTQNIEQFADVGAQEREPETVLGGECLVALDRLRADGQHLGADVGELLDVVGVGVQLLRAHRRVVARVEDEHDRLAAVLGQRVRRPPVPGS